MDSREKGKLFSLQQYTVTMDGDNTHETNTVAALSQREKDRTLRSREHRQKLNSLQLFHHLGFFVRIFMVLLILLVSNFFSETANGLSQVQSMRMFFICAQHMHFIAIFLLGVNIPLESLCSRFLALILSVSVSAMCISFHEFYCHCYRLLSRSPHQYANELGQDTEQAKCMAFISFSLFSSA